MEPTRWNAISEPNAAEELLPLGRPPVQRPELSLSFPRHPLTSTGSEAIPSGWSAIWHARHDGRVLRGFETDW